MEGEAERSASESTDSPRLDSAENLAPAAVDRVAFLSTPDSVRVPVPEPLPEPNSLSTPSSSAIGTVICFIPHYALILELICFYS